MSDRKGSEARNRAYDHYRWAERYSRQGNNEKAKAHMQRAVHYGKAAFGAVTGTGDERAAEPDPKVDIIFVLSPLNHSAVTRIIASINQSINYGNSVEVYVQAFTKKQGIGAFTAPNLTPMNFNQYSSDNPLALVDIINNFKGSERVRFYIFPTQTTKNAMFNPACTTALKNLVLNQKELSEIDPWMKAAIVAWGIKDTKNADKTDVVERLKFTDLTGDAVGGYLRTWNPQPVFDPFCVYWAVDASLRERGNWPIKAHPTEVSVAKDDGMDIPDFAIKIDPTPQSNCFYVIWDQARLDSLREAMEATNEKLKTTDEALTVATTKEKQAQLQELKKKADADLQKIKADAQKVEDDMKLHVSFDALEYISALWESFKQKPRCERKAAKRRVHNMLIVQDYYDYDNKMSVWYALYMFEVRGALELLSITRPVADRATMVKMRKNGGAFAYAGKAPPTPLQAATEADKWPAAPVITEANFAAHTKNILDNAGSYSGPTFEEYQDAINPKRTDAHEISDKEARDITSTWNLWLKRFYEQHPEEPKPKLYFARNGGYTNRHGLNPVMHTLMEDWFKEPDHTELKRKADGH